MLQSLITANTIKELKEKLAAQLQVLENETTKGVKIESAIIQSPNVELKKEKPSPNVALFPIELKKEKPSPLKDQELDSAGQPWNPEIHSPGKVKKLDGIWRAKKSIKEIEVPTSPIVAPEPQPVVQQESPQTPHMSVTYDNIPVPTTTKPAHTYESFKKNFISLLAQLTNDKKITQHYMIELKKYFGVKEIWHVLLEEEKCKEMYENFCGSGLITRLEQ